MTKRGARTWWTWLLPVLASACTYGAPEPGPVPIERYRALGQEPGWSLTIEGDLIDYVGNYGETRISVPRPTARPSFNGLRYETDRLVVDITYSRCNDAMSGHGYAHQVMVIADGTTVSGCGGERQPDWDM